MTTALPAEPHPLPAADSSSAVQTPLRNDFLDALRLFAAFGVVWIHSFEPKQGPSLENVGRFAVPFFTVLSIWLMSRRPEPTEPLGVAAGSWLTFTQKRFVRLYVPFLIWNLIYTGLRYLKLRSMHRDPSFPITLGYFVTGVSLQLWFLPFLLIVQSVARAVLSIATYGRALRWLCVGACGVGLVASFTFHGTVTRWGLSYLFEVMPTALPAACVATAVALLGLHRRFVPKSVCVAGLVVTAVTTLAVILHGRNYVLEMISGLGLAVAALHPVRGPVVATLGKLGAFAFGIYLVHSGILDVLRQIVPRLHIVDTTALHVGLAVAASVLALAFCVLFVRLPFGEPAARWLGLKSH